MDIRHVLADHGIEDSRKVIAEFDISELNQRLTDLSQFVTGAFADGLIETMEAKKIEIYINQLVDTNNKINERYVLLMDNAALDLVSAERLELKNAKDLYDVRLDALISTIERAVADGKSTREEAEAVDTAYVYMMEASARLERAFQKAADFILGKRTIIAEDNAKSYADDLKAEIDAETKKLADDLRNYEGYVNGAFRDGIVTEFEARNIASYKATIRMQKTEMDRRVEFLLTSPFLADGIPARINLTEAYGDYNVAHNHLMNLIDLVIEDGESTAEEAAEIQNQFVELDNKLRVLITSLEKAADSIAQLRADTAENLAREFAAEIAGEKAMLAQEAAEAFTRQEAEHIRLQVEAMEDGLISEEERAAIDESLRNLEAAQEEMERRIEEAREANEQFVRDQIEDADIATHAYITARNNLERLYYEVYRDGIVTPEEQQALDDAQHRLNQAKGEVDNETREAILAAKNYSDQQAKEAEEAAKEYAAAEAEAKRVIAEAYADGLVTAEEQARIEDAQAKLAEAKQHAEKEAEDAREAAILASGDYVDREIKEISKSTIRMQKSEMDLRTEFTLTNPFLENGIPARTDLTQAYAKYTETYDRLMYLIERIFPTPEEKAEIQNQYSILDDRLKVLITALERAAESIAQLRVDTAENVAKEFATDVAGEKARLAQEAAEGLIAREAEHIRLQMEAMEDGLISEEERAAIDESLRGLEEAQAELERRIEEAREANEAFVREQIDEADIATQTYLNARTHFERLYYEAHSDGVITPEESQALTEAQRQLDAAKGEADTETREAILAAKNYSDQQAKEAEDAAKTYALQEAEANRVIAEAYADGLVTAEEQARIDDAQAKLEEAKRHAEKEAQDAREAAILASGDYVDREIKDIKDNLILSVQLNSTNGNIFLNGNISTTFEARVFRGANDITSTLPPGSYAWQRVSNNPEEDEVWNAAHANVGTTIELTRDDIHGKAIIGLKVYEDALPAPEN